MKYIYLLISIFLFCNSTSIAQDFNPKLETLDVTLNYSGTFVFYSEEVQDSFHIYIKLPKGYDKNIEKTYPGIFLLDGDIAFPMAWGIVRYLQYDKDVPDILIVGIGYGGLSSSNSINKRERDYSISKIDGLKDSGGGKKFLNFIKKELLPFLSSNYRLNNTKLTLSGHSLGGLFVLYTLFSEPKLFSNYISISPYVLQDIDKLLLLIDSNKIKIEDSNSRLFISVGANEEEKEFKDPINKIINRLNQIDSSSFKLKLKVFEDGFHFSTPAEGLTYGLIFSFE
jgi:predicted alpha/beta superfamily hydrolase